MVDEASLGFDPIRFDLELNRRNANKPADLEVELKKERTRNRLPSRKLVQVVAFGTHTHIYIYIYIHTPSTPSRAAAKLSSATFG